MERRKFLIGAGSTAIGASALVGSGAFSAVEAERNLDLRVRNDGNAYLGLETGESDIASYDDGRLELDIDDLNADASTEFTDAFTIVNQGSREVRVWVDFDGLSGHWNIEAYTGHDDPNASMTAEGVILDSGKSVGVSLLIGGYDGSTPDPGTSESGEFTIYGVSDDSDSHPDEGPSSHGNAPEIE
ncbi:hypothetical protein [Natronococcus roseus]|uniref:hypothetical protein n=1 Tax=Natronococcus roseus TaxID=1052014 RepID=UPI00374DBEA6